jgi:phospholipase C
MLRFNFKRWRQQGVVCVSLVALMSIAFDSSRSQSTSAGSKGHRTPTDTPIKHVIVLIGENRTFDHIFATYVPKSDDSVSNLLSKGIIKGDGSPGPNFSQAAQFQAVKPYQTQYFTSLSKTEKAPYSVLPQPTLNFAPTKTVFPPGTRRRFWLRSNLLWSPSI